MIINKVILYDNIKVDLPYYSSFKKREIYTYKKIFKKHRRYIEKGWLGAKKVNNPNPIENVKRIMGTLTGYLMGTKEYSIKDSINNYLMFKRKSDKEELSQAEKLELLILKNNIIYEDRDIVFMINAKLEHRLNKTIRYYYRFDKDSDMIEKIQEKLDNIKKNKQKVIENKENMSNLHKKRRELNNIIKEEYKLFQDTNDKNSIDSIVKLANEINNINSDIEDCKYQIVIAYDDYLLDTELYYKTK